MLFLNMVCLIVAPTDSPGDVPAGDLPHPHWLHRLHEANSGIRQRISEAVDAVWVAIPDPLIGTGQATHRAWEVLGINFVTRR
jgi:hypothetical protein